MMDQPNLLKGVIKDSINQKFTTKKNKDKLFNGKLLPFKPLMVVTYCDDNDKDNSVPFRLWRILSKFNAPFVLDINGTKKITSLIDYWNENFLQICDWNQEQINKIQYIKVHTGFTKWTDEDTSDARCMAGIMYLYRSHLTKPKVKKQDYTHIIWYTPRHSSIEELQDVLQACRNSYSRKEPKLVFKHSGNGFPFVGAAYWFGFNFLTPDMIKTNKEEEYNIILEPLNVKL